MRIAALFISLPSMCGSRGGIGGPEPPEKSQKYRVSCNTGPDLLENHKTTKPAFNVGSSSGCQRNAIYICLFILVV